MAENRISANLAPADKKAVMQAIATIREKLPFLIDLTTEDRRTIIKMGDKSRAFVTKALEVATQNPEFLPRSFDLEEMRRDLGIFEDLYPVLLSLTQLQRFSVSKPVALWNKPIKADFKELFKSLGKGVVNIYLFYTHIYPRVVIWLDEIIRLCKKSWSKL